MTVEMHCPKCRHTWSLPSVRVDDIPDAVVERESLAVYGEMESSDDADDEPIEFAPLDEELAAFAKSAPSLSVVLKLSDRQLRDVLYAATSIGSSTLYLCVLASICLALQGFLIVVGFLAFLSSTIDLAKVAGLVTIIALALATLVSAMLLANYGNSLREFVRSKEPDSLIESLRSGSRFWLWMAIMMTFALGLGAMAFFAVLAENH
jgi:hypothetical protein